VQTGCGAARRRIRDAQRQTERSGQLSLKLIVIVIRASTGWPFFSTGS
jgi:hypothetical protein